MKVYKEKKIYRYYVTSIFIGLITIVGFSIAILKVSQDVALLKGAVSMNLVSAFYFFALLASFLNAYIWKILNHQFGFEKRFTDALIDTALMSLGKYVPGKIWGAVVRARSGNSLKKIEPRRIYLSFFEIAYSLSVGSAVAVCFFLIYFFKFNLIYAVITIAITISVVILLVRLVWKFMQVLGNKFVAKNDIALVDHSVFILSYFLLWILTTIPFYLLLISTDPLSTNHFFEVAVSFIVSIIAGFLVIFAPAGIGVREVVFSFMSQDSLGWQGAFTVIALHRILLISFDVIYGFICMVTLVVRSNCKW